MRTPTILCVDDERNVLLTLRAQFQRQFPDYLVEIAESGAEALALVEELLAEGSEVALVIADQMMPGMKGDQLLIELHRRHPQIIQVMLAGQASAAEVGNVVNQGSLYRFLSKPWNETDLQLTVNEALRRYRQEQQLAQQHLILEQVNQELTILNANLEQQVQQRSQALQQEMDRRQSIEDELRVSEERYRLLSEISPVGIFRNDLQGRCTYANAKTLEITGLSLTENLGEGWGQNLHPDDRDWMCAAWSKFVQQVNLGQESEYRVEHRYLYADGSVKWGLAQAVPERNAAGELIGFVGSVIDITDRKQAEESLRQSESRLINAQRIAHLGYWEFDLVTQKIVWSEELFHIFGLDPAQGEPTYAAFQQQVHPEDWPILQAAINRTITDGTPYEVEHRIFHPDGSLRYILGRGEAVFNTGGQVVRLVGTGLDQTSAKQVELALRESEERNRAILSAIPDIMVVTNAAGQYLSISFNQFTGEVVPLDIARQSATEVFPPETVGSWLSAIQQALQTGTLQTFEQQISFGDRLQYEEVRVVPYQADKVLCMVQNITDRKRAELALATSERLYTSLAEASPVAIFRNDGDGNCTYVNGRWVGMTGLTAEQSYGMGWIQAIHPDDRQRIFTEWRQAVAAGIALRTEGRYLHADGSVVWIYSQIVPEVDLNGKVVGYVGTSTDITTLKQTEVALRDSEARLRRLSENLPGVVYRYVQYPDGRGAFLYMSHRCEEVYGISPEAAMQDANLLWDSVHPDDLTLLQSKIALSIQNPEHIFYVEHRMITADGQIKWVQIASRPERQANGDLIWDGVVIDITTRKQAELALQESQQLIQQIANSSPNVIYIYDLAQQRNVYVNQEVQTFLGYTHDEVMERVDQSLANLMHPEDLAWAAQHFEQLSELPDGAVAEFEYRMQHKNGEWRWFSSRDTVFKRDGDGRVMQILGNAQDITSRKQAEQALQDSERKYHQILDSITDMVLVKDGYFRLVWGNKAFRDYYGMSVEELEGMIDAPFNEPDYTLQYIRDDAFVFSTGQTLNIAEEPVTRHDGVVRIFSTVKAPIQDDSGQVALLVAVCRDITEQKQVEAEIRQSQQQLSAIASNIPGGVFRFIYHADGSYSCPFASEGYRTLLGIDPEAFKANPEMNLAMVHPDDRSLYEAAAAAAIAGQETSFQGEVRYLLATGETKWISTSAQLYREANGDVIVDGIDIDITYRKQIELEITQSRDLREAIFNESADALFLVDPETLLTLDCNNRALELFEADTKKQLVNVRGQTLQRFDFTAKELEQIVGALNDQGVWRGELEYVTLKGKLFWGSLAAKRIRIAKQSLNLVRVTDISTRKQAEIELQQREAQLTAVASNVPGGVFRILRRADGTYSNLFASEGYRTLCGISPEQTKADPDLFIRMIHPEDQERHFAAWEAAIRGNHTFYGEARYVLPTEETKWIATRAQFHQQGNGDVIIDGLDIDITDRKQLELELRQREEFLNSIYNGVAIAITVIDVEPEGQFRYIDFNPTCEQLSNVDCNLLRGKTLEELSPLITLAEIEAVRAQFQQCATTGEPVQFETAVMINGQPQWWLNQHAPLKDERGRVYRLVGTSIPITARKQAEAQLEVQNSLLSRIAQNEPLAEILKSIIARIEQQLPGAMGSVLLLDDSNRLRHGAALSLPSDYIQAADGILIGDGVGSCGTAAFLKQPVIVSDIATDPLWESYKEFTLAYGLRACWSMPILTADERALGTFAVYYTEVRSPQGNELQLIDQLANIAGIAIERDRAEAQIRRSEEQLQLTLDFTGIGAWNWHPITGDYAWTGKMAELLELPLGLENMFEIWCSRIHPDDLDYVQSSLQTALSNHHAFTAEYRYRLSDGRTVWRWVKGQGIYTETGEIERVLGVTQDITDRKRAEEALRASEAGYRRIIETANEGIWILDAENRTSFVNPKMGELLGYSPDEMIGQALFDFMDEDGVVFALENIERRRQGVAEQHDFKLQHRNGMDVWVWISTNPILDEAGEYIGTLGMITDITDRKQVEQALQRSEEKLRLALEFGQVAVWDWDASEEKLEWSDLLYEMLGYRPGSVVPSFDAWFQSIHPADRDTITQAWDAALAEKQDFIVEYRVLRSDGSQRWISDCGRGIYAANGQLLRSVGIMLDITARKQTELALQQLNEELELRVQQRTQALLDSQSQLQTKEQFLRGIFEGTENALFVVDILTDGSFQYTGWNHACEVMTGVSSADVLGKSPQKVFGEEVGTAMVQHCRRCCKLEGFIRYEEHLFFEPGEVWTLTTLNPLKDSDGRIYRIVGNAFDITDRKWAEAQLREQEQFLRSIYEGTSQPIFVADVQPDGTVREVGWNPASECLSGRLSEEVAGKSMEEIFGAEEGAAISARYAQCIAARQPMTFEECITFQGQTRWMLSTYNPLINAEGRVHRVVGTVFEITERKQIEEALRQKEEQYRTIFEAVSDGIFIHDLETGQLVEVNPATCRMHGYSREEMLTLPPSAYIHSDSLSLFDEYLQTLKTGAPFFKQSADIHKDGTVFDIEIAGTSFVFNGKPHALGLLRDISDRKRAELALRESEERFRQLAESINGVFWLTDLQPQILYVSPAFERVWQRQADEVFQSYETFLETIHPEDRSHTTQEMAQRFERHVDLKYRILWPNGEVRWIRDRTFHIYNETGELYRLAGLAEDITEQKQTEVALHEARQFAQSIADKTPAALYIYDLIEQCNCYSNRSILDLLGYTPDEIQAMGQDLMPTLLHPGDAAAVVAHQQRLLNAKDGEDLELEYRMHHANGEWRWFYSRDSVFKRNAEGNVTQYIGAAQDITERKRLEQDLRQINTELEQRVMDRTQDLQHAMEAAQAANHAKTTFLSNMSHELRTPLNAILGFSQLLNRDDNLTLDQQEQVNIINRSGEHLLNLINDILAMSKIEAGRITLTVNCFNLRELLQDLEELFRLKAEAKQLMLAMRISARVPQVIQTDEGKLRQVLINLLSNAIKFTDQGSVTLRVWTEEQPLATQFNTVSNAVSNAVSLDLQPLSLHFEVEDTGCGIERAEQAAVFEPFGQTQSGRNSQEGTGLGLPISRQFVELMGGELLFTSVPNHGSCFYFTIPVEEVAADCWLPNVSTAPVIGLVAGQPSYRLLVVEDNPENRQFLVQLLSSVGFEVRAAVNGQEAVRLWQTWAPHLIWMDMRMPVMDGYTATQQIRLLEQQAGIAQPRTKILALTASAFEDERATILAAGCDDFLFKPTTEAVLFEKIAQHLGVCYIYRDPSAPPTPTPEASSDGLTTMVQRMPSAWVAQLRFAARIADEDLLLEAIDQLPTSEASLANALRELVTALQLEEVIALTQDMEDISES